MLADGTADLTMPQVVPVTTLRAREMLFSESYLDETLALMVPDHRRDQFASWDAIRDLGAITILAPDQPYTPTSCASLPRALSSGFSPWTSRYCLSPTRASTQCSCPPNAALPGR